MRTRRFAVLDAGLVTIACALAQAQGPDTLSAAQRAGVALARLGVGQRVRIRAGGALGLVEGRVVSNSSDLVALVTPDESTIEVPAPGVDSLWVRHGTYAGRGALIGGAVVGIGLGAFFAAVAADFNSRHKYCGQSGCDVGYFFAGGLVVGGAGGAIVGTLMGVAVPPKWHLWVP